jgi:hypothetical protein
MAGFDADCRRLYGGTGNFMINQYRTLILNLPDLGDPNEFISPGFLGLQLTPELQAVYNLLFPANTSRSYKQFLYYYYEQLLRATNQLQFLNGVDSRVTYTPEQLGNYFQINRVSVPVGTSSAFPLLVTGAYSFPATLSGNYEGFVVTQLGSSSNIVVYSNQQKAYLNGPIKTISPDASVQISITFTNNISNLFPIGTTGLSARISGISGNFGAVGNKSWTFVAESPFELNFNTFFESLTQAYSTVEQLLLSSPIDQTSQNLWQFHFNPVYRFAGLLNSYFIKVNALCPT